MKPGRLFWKLFVAFWMATSLTFLVGLGILMFTSFGPGDPEMRAMLASEIRMVEQYGETAGGQLLDVWGLHPTQEVGLFDDRGGLLAGTEVSHVRYEKQLTSKEGNTLWLKSSVAASNELEQRPFGFTPLLIGTVMSALFSWLLTWYLLRPLEHLSRAMSCLAKGQFETRIKPLMGNRRDEIVDLASDCDTMADQLKVLVESQQQLLHDISHELRSPLTRMHAAIGLLHQDPARHEMLGRIERESERIDTLIEELLTLARVQARPDSVEREPLDIVELLAAITEDAQFEASAKCCRVTFKTGQPFVSRINGELLYRAFENVIRNAVRHAPAGTEVLICAEIDAQQDALIVRIIDQGPGVENRRLHSIFQPFERGIDDTTDGFGLGLAIALRAIEMHSGHIAAHNMSVGGLMVEIRLPRKA
ncbi:MAG TPA: ATP-binding protein [Pseudomonas sp.]|jgi:signal transduction histidine kinase